MIRKLRFFVEEIEQLSFFILRGRSKRGNKQFNGRFRVASASASAFTSTSGSAAAAPTAQTSQNLVAMTSVIAMYGGLTVNAGTKCVTQVRPRKENPST